MARILYGLCGVGIGHAVRGKVILNHLKKKHEVMIICSHKPYEYLSKIFNNVHKIEGFELEFKRNGILESLTVLNNLKKFSRKNYNQLKEIIEKIKKFNPDYVISDWETLSSFVAKKLKIPLISIDNQHFLMKGHFKVPKKYFFDYLKTKMVISLLMKKANYYIISSFYSTKLKKKEKGVFLVPPVLRDEIFKAKPKKEDYFLVYQSTKTYNKLIKILRDVDAKFIIYGFDKVEKNGHIEFKKFNEKEFLKDLINCKGVVCNGGFTLISEAIHLKKPLFTVPIKKHFEQLLNCNYVKMLGCGEFYKDITNENIKKFVSDINRYKFKFSGQKNNGVIFGILDDIIK